MVMIPIKVQGKKNEGCDTMKDEAHFVEKSDSMIDDLNTSKQGLLQEQVVNLMVKEKLLAYELMGFQIRKKTMMFNCVSLIREKKLGQIIAAVLWIIVVVRDRVMWQHEN